MSHRLRSSLALLATAVALGNTAFVGSSCRKTEAATTSTVTVTSAALPAPVVPSSWCGPGFETIYGDTCYIDGRDGGERRTLVIWLHGVIGKNTSWSHDHQKMLLRFAKASDIEMIFPKGLAADSVYAWPGTTQSQEENEEALIEQWMIARDRLEKREHKTYDETFIFGFSSGAYFASSLAMRGRVDVDGYAVFAGGQPMPPAPEPYTHFAPVFVGICLDDPTGTANHARALTSSLAAAGIPFRASEESIGHDLSPTQFTSALAFLRKSKADTPAPNVTR